MGLLRSIIPSTRSNNSNRISSTSSLGRGEYAYSNRETNGGCPVARNGSQGRQNSPEYSRKSSISERSDVSLHSTRESSGNNLTRSGASPTKKTKGYRARWLGAHGKNDKDEEAALLVKVHHYMPSRFPYAQRITQQDIIYVKEIWAQIANDNTVDANGKSRLSLLFDIFYNNLFTRSRKFKEYFGGDFKERCRILTRQMAFYCSLQLDETLKEKFRRLGRLHYELQISNWQYATFTEVLVESIATVLGKNADMNHMYSLTRVLSFCLYSLLKETLSQGMIKIDDMNVNYEQTALKVDATGTAENIIGGSQP